MYKYVIKFNSKPSGYSPCGQKDAFAIASASLAYANTAYGSAGDKAGSTVMDTSYFTLYEPEDKNTGYDQKMLEDLYAYITQITTTKMSPDTITLMEVTTTGDSGQYKINSSAEHEQALVGISNRGGLIVTSDKAKSSTIPEGGEQANFRTEIDFQNRRINPK